MSSLTHIARASQHGEWSASKTTNNATIILEVLWRFLKIGIPPVIINSIVVFFMKWNIQLLGPPHKVTIDSTFLVDVPLAKSWLQPSQLDTKSSEAQRVVQGLEHTSAQWWPQSNNLLHLDMHLAAICSFVERHSLPLVNPTPKASKHLDPYNLKTWKKSIQPNPKQTKMQTWLVNSDWYVQPFWAALQKFPINPLPPQKKEKIPNFQKPRPRILTFFGCAGQTGHSKSLISLHSLGKTHTSEPWPGINMRNFVISMTGWWLGPLKNMSSSVGMMKFPIYGK